MFERLAMSALACPEGLGPAARYDVEALIDDVNAMGRAVVAAHCGNRSARDVALDTALSRSARENPRAGPYPQHVAIL